MFGVRCSVFASCLSSFLLHHQNERSDERDRKDEADALQWPDVIRHQCFADLFDGNWLDWRCGNREGWGVQDYPEQSTEDSQRHDHAAPVNATIANVIATSKQDRENNQDCDR